MKNKLIKINGKIYPFWFQFINRKNEFVEGILEDFGNSMDQQFGAKPVKTIITDIILKPNGKESAWFEISGKDFSCGFDVRVGGVIPGEEGWLTFGGYGGHMFRIKNK